MQTFHNKFILLLSSCTLMMLGNFAFAENSDSAKKPNSSTQNKPALSSNQQCPADNFSEFLKIYANNTKIQDKFTKFPLQELVIVDAEPEPKQITRLLKRNQVKLPLIPLADERKKQGLTLQVIQQKQSPFEVKLEKPDTGYLVHYYFTKENKCWHLVRMDDSSL